MTVNALLYAAFGLLISINAQAVEEGIDYTELSSPQPTENSANVEVREVFLYSCPHCYHLEPTIEKWLESKPANVDFLRMPAIFGTKVVPHAKAFYAAELLDKGDQFHVPLFKALHDDKEQIWDEDALVAFAMRQGIDGNEFRKAYNSFAVNMNVNRARELGKRYGIDGVPAIVVNGKYRTSPSQTGSRAKMVDVIDHLIAVESGQAVAED